MTVAVKLYASLRKYLPSESMSAVRVEVPAGATVADVIARLGIPPEHTRMIVSGDRQLDLAAVLEDGQEISILPPLAGGA